MKTKHLRLSALAAVPAALLCTSCIEDDWDDDYYGSRRPRYYDRYDYDDYDDGYRAGYEDRRRDERRYDRGRRDRDDRRGGPASPRIPKGFVRAGSYTSGKTIEAPIPTRNPIKQILIASTSGSVAVNTVVLREGGAKTPYPISARIEAGQTRTVDLGGRRKATGIRVSTGGKGTFDVYVR